MNTTAIDYVSAVFNNEADAQAAVDDLRSQGVPESALSVVAREGDRTTATGAAADAVDATADTAGDALKGTAIGAGVGAIFGLAAAAIPGIGPFITAGALANLLGATGGAAVAGAVVGGASGGLASALSSLGHNADEANYYAGEIERGGIFVSVDTARANISASAVRAILERHNGRFAS